MRLLALFSMLVILTAALPLQDADAQRRGLSLVRDAEIEALVKDYARPLMKAAGLRSGSVEFYLVNDAGFNAFVSGRGMFLNTGLILRADSPEEVIGVIAHELGHVVGGHQLRLRQRLEHAAKVARITSLLGVGVGAAGAVAGVRGSASAGLAIATGGSSIAMRDLLRYQRGEETAADRMAATFLDKAGLGGQGMLKTFRRLSEDLSILGGRIDPYTVSHPLPNQRIVNMENVLKRSRHFGKRVSKGLQQRHDMARAKIAAYTGNGSYARSLLQGKELSPAARLYGRAIVAFLYGSPQNALPLIDKLLKQQPKNAYIHEMKGEIMLRTGKPKQAIAPFRRAIQYDRADAGYLNVELGHALIESGSPKNLDDGIANLKKGLARDPSALAGWQYLAIAYQRKGMESEALLASAQLAARTGRKNQAKQYARRAQQGFKRGSPAWLRAEDIITYN